MTRINCIPVEELTREHLVAEYRELPRVFGLARAFREGEKIPEHYTLGFGHVKFFYTRLGWCANRHTQLVQAMKLRGYKPTIGEHEMWQHCEKAGGDVPLELFKSWEPDEAAMELNRQRIRERLK